jgi:hypothetical protein
MGRTASHIRGGGESPTAQRLAPQAVNCPLFLDQRIAIEHERAWLEALRGRPP